MTRWTIILCLSMVATQVILSMASSEVRVTVNGQDLYTSEADDGICGDADPRWRVRVSITDTSNWVNWNEDRDEIGNSGWQGISKSGLFSGADVSFSNNLYLELDAWEDDSFLCLGDDGDCDGYGGLVTVPITSNGACQFHTVEISRTCQSDGTTIDWGARVEYYYEYKEGQVISCSPPTPSPTDDPTKEPTASPTKQPTHQPTNSPSKTPSVSPSASPSYTPTIPEPTSSPSMSPTNFTTPSPTTISPTLSPTNNPSSSPNMPTSTEVPTQSPNIAAAGTLAGGEYIVISAGAVAVVGSLALAFFVYRRRKQIRKVKSQILEAKVSTNYQEKEEEEELDTKSAFEYENITKLDPESVAPKAKTPPGLGYSRESIEASNAQNVLKKLNFNNGEYEGRQLRVVYDFKAEHPDELSATAGQELFCLDKKEEWFVAKNLETGETGIIPANFVQLD